ERPDQAVGQHGDRPVLSRAAARPALHRRPAAQGDRLLQCRPHAGRQLERDDQGRRRPATLYREHPLLGDTRLCDDGAAQLLDVREPGRPEVEQPRGAGAGHVAQIPGHAGPGGSEAQRAQARVPPGR
ncbi:hypothetical protein QU38_00140, partial [Staphylococcus aureus]